MKLLRVFLFACVFFLAPAHAFAAERVVSFSSFIDIQSDASIHVTEHIQYDFGAQERHGIYRDLPYKYKTLAGNLTIKYSDFSVTNISGNTIPFTQSKETSNIQLKIGDPNKTLSGIHTYVISYTVDRVINYFDSHDELYWNIIGNDWEVPIESVIATVALPTSVKSDAIQAQCFAGPYGSTLLCDTVSVINNSDGESNEIQFLNSKLAPGNGLTVVVGFPKNIVDEPSLLARTLQILADNWIAGLPLLVFIVLYLAWWKYGKDPGRKRAIVHQFEPPSELTPAEVGTIYDERVQGKDVTATIIDLAIRGYIKITRIPNDGFFGSDDYQLDKLGTDTTGLRSHEIKLINALFSGNKNTVKLSDLKNSFASHYKKVVEQIYTSTVKKNLFPKSPQKVRRWYLIAGIILIIGTIQFIGFITQGSIAIISAFVSGIIIVIFSFLMPVKTLSGVRAKEHIEGLKRYIAVAEKDRIKFHNAPKKDPERFEKLLPYAIVLGVEKEWAKQFEDIVKEEPNWYHDTTGKSFGTLHFANNLSSFSTQASSTLSSTASSGGSGFSGGGSGGGFGGGGGGSW